jgi:hypothetical protein
MNYKQFLTFISQYGHGVFTVTMLDSSSERKTLTSFINNNLDFFEGLKVAQGQVRIFKLTFKGMSYFGFKRKPCKTMEVYSLLEYVLINSYLINNNAHIKYTIKPYCMLTINNLKVGILSAKWGIPRNINEYDVLVSYKTFVKELFNNHDLLLQYSKRNGIELDKLAKEIQLKTQYVSALRNIRDSEWSAK